MSNNAGERDVARRMGFGRPRPRLEILSRGTGSEAPRSLLEVLGVRSGQKAAFIGVGEQHVRPSGSRSPIHSSTSAPLHPVDVIVYQVANAFALRRIRELAPFVKDGGALWVLWPRGESHITQNHVQRSGLTAGLVDIAAVGISDQLAALKFVHGRGGR